jgi:hypothetical protein
MNYWSWSAGADTSAVMVRLDRTISSRHASELTDGPVELFSAADQTERMRRLLAARS